MTATAFIASAPGSLMLMGEHAVLADKLALCAAVDLRLTVSLIPRSDNIITIDSPSFSFYQTTIAQLTIEQPYPFILAVLKTYQSLLTQGCDIKITAGFSSVMGLGSSAAVTVATLQAIHQWLNLSLLAKDCFMVARKIIRQVQGRGSGTDVAASIWGGVIAYKQYDIEPILLKGKPELTVVYCGYKTPTIEVIAHVQKNFSACPAQLARIYQAIDNCSQQALLAWQQEDWKKIGVLFNQQFILQQKLGVSDTALDHIVQRLQQQTNLYGAKISGSGLGDCAIALGQCSPLFPDKILPAAQQFSLSIATQGVLSHAHN